jgi:hypothetical protein
MTELEFEILDELYFISSYQELQENTGLASSQLLAALQEVYRKGWLRCYRQPDDEILSDQVDIKTNGPEYYYLASKSGLLAHNTVG